jgi:type IV pilus assembly protein PilO
MQGSEQMNIKVVGEILKLQPKTFILITVMILANICLFLFSAFYQMPRFEKLQKQWLDKRKISTVGAGQDVSMLYQQGVKDLTTWRGRIIPKREFAKFIGTLFETATNNSLAFNGVSYKVVPLKEKGLTAYTLDFNVSGKYGAVKSFIADMGRIPEIVTIDGVSINNKAFMVDLVELKIQLTVYLKLEEQ